MCIENIFFKTKYEMKLLCGEAEEEMTNCKENKATSQGLNVETRWWIRSSCPS